MSVKKTAVVIPIYKIDFSENERTSLRRVFEVLSGHKIIAAVPESLDTVQLSLSFPALEYRRFGDSNFKGIRAYNKMMLDSSFYKRFSDYEYILIYQLDAYVFYDRLQEWAERGYSYIGAPWIPTRKKYCTFWGKIILPFLRKFKTSDRKRLRDTFYNVGNGGFSLRNVDDFIKITEKYKDKIADQLADNKPFYPEDLWIFYETSTHEISRPGWKEALEFAFEQNPEESFRLNKERLPFGCHAWYHKEYGSFWKGLIK